MTPPRYTARINGTEPYITVSFSPMMDLGFFLNWPVRYVFALKPAIDATSTLLFSGEYRQYPIAAATAIRAAVKRRFFAVSGSTQIDSVNSVSVRPAAQSISSSRRV